MSNLNALIGDLNKKYGDGIVSVGTSRLYVDKIPFSSPRANYMTYGGVPLGMAVEFFGTEGGGKTTSALDITGQAQKKAIREYDEELSDLSKQLADMVEKNNKSDQKKIAKLEEAVATLMNKGPKRVVYIDAENTLDEDWARLMGVDTESLILIRPQDQTAEQILQMVIDIVSTGDVILVVLDSIPMLVSQQIYEESMEKKAYCGVAGPMAIFSSRISSKLSKNKCTLILINQVREDINNPYNLYNTPGGRGLRHLYALRLMFQKGSLIDENNKEQPNRFEEPMGNLVSVSIVKTKVCKPDRKVGFYTLKYYEGIDVLADTVDLAVKYDIISQTGSWYNVLDEDGELMEDADGNPLKFQGKTKLLEFLRDDDILFNELAERLMKLIC